MDDLVEVIELVDCNLSVFLVIEGDLVVVGDFGSNLEPWLLVLSFESDFIRSRVLSCFKAFA